MSRKVTYNDYDHPFNYGSRVKLTEAPAFEGVILEFRKTMASHRQVKVRWSNSLNSQDTWVNIQDLVLLDNGIERAIRRL